MKICKASAGTRSMVKSGLQACHRVARVGPLLVFFVCAPLVVAQKKENVRVMGLVELYGISASIIYGEEDEFSANLLSEFLKPHLKGIKTIPAKETKARNDDLVIYVGSFDKNSPSAKTFKSLGYSLNWDALTEGSFLLKTFRKEGKTTIFVTGKDWLGTLYAAQDLKNCYLRIEMGRVLLNELNLTERAQLKYRWFRVLDRRTNWQAAETGVGLGAETAGSSKPGAYRGQLKAIVDYMSERRLNGLTLWGFPGAPEGGVAAAQELCKYALERGVRVLLRVGLTGSEGVFSEGDHAFNLDAWAKAHPELRAVDKAGAFRDGTLCPEKIENRQRYREGLHWLIQNFQIGGVSLELEPFFVCYSEDCKRARQTSGSDPDYSKDLERFVGFIAEEVRKLNPKAWVTYLAGTGFDVESIQSASAGAMPLGQRAAFPPEFIQKIPEFALAQWELAPMLKAGIWPSPFKAPGKHGLGLIRWGAGTASTPQEIYWKRIEGVTHHTISSNLEGLTTYGELSPDNPAAELNYLIFSALAFNPAADLDEFFRFKVSRLYGGEEAAHRLSKILQLLEDETGMLAKNYQEALRLSKQGAELSDRNGKERWTRLIQYIEGMKK